MNHWIKSYISISSLLITIASVNQWSNLPIGNTAFWWVIYITVILAFIQARKYYYDTENNKNTGYIIAFTIWNFICIVRGMFVAENYWDWKNMISTSMYLMLPFIFFVASNKFAIQSIISVWYKYALVLFAILVFFLQGEAYGRYLAPIGFLLLFFPIISNKWKIISILLVLFVIFSYLDGRSSIIKFLVPLLFSFIYFFRHYIRVKLLEFIRLALLITPVIFFSLGATGIFNVFNMDEYIGEYITEVNDGNNKTEVYLTADTRTFLYQEVLNSAIKYKYVLWGRTPAMGNESEEFGYYAQENLKMGRKERYSNEVSILNMFTWNGLIGVSAFFLVFWGASYKAIHKSRNTFIKIIGLYVAFRWLYAWVEDFSEFDIANMFLWIMISMCYSESFRKMNDKEFIIWIKGITDIKYRYLQHKLNKLKLNG